MAINYEQVGWDTSKYVNPTRMNHMDDGIKKACDKADAHDQQIETINSNLSPKDLSNEISSESCIVNDSDVVKIGNFIIFDISFYPKDGGSISGDVWNAISFGNIVPKINGSSLGIGRVGANCFPIEFDFYTDGRTHLYAPSGVSYIRIHGMFKV